MCSPAPGSCTGGVLAEGTNVRRVRYQAAKRSAETLVAGGSKMVKLNVGTPAPVAVSLPSNALAHVP